MSNGPDWTMVAIWAMFLVSGGLLAAIAVIVHGGNGKDKQPATKPARPGDDEPARPGDDDVIDAEFERNTTARRVDGYV